jgi:hypothetical protein
VTISVSRKRARQRRRGRQHLPCQEEARKDRETTGQNGASATELDDRLRVGQAGKRIRRAGQLEHQNRMSEAVVAAQNEFDLGDFVGVRSARKRDGVQQDADERRW